MYRSTNSYDVIIAGAGPAGTSAAIHLASRGVRVLLVEQKKFPRAKLCGEFISPECRLHFRILGVEDQMTDASPTYLTDTVFYSKTGHKVSVPSEWFLGHDSALGLSRAEMDYRLLQKAKSVGVVVLEGVGVSDVLVSGKQCMGVRVKTESQAEDYHSLVTLDATGRRRALVGKLNRQRGIRFAQNGKPSLVAFKAHLENTRVAEATCEIYSYPGGYGGLSRIEGGLTNLCFIAAADDVRTCDSDPEIVVRKIVSKNRRAAYTLANAVMRTEWLCVSLDNFGAQPLVPIAGLLTVGDAAAFIDPFTGSGMLMALESGALASAAILTHLERLKQDSSFESLSQEYRKSYREKFAARLRVSGLLRRAPSIPYAPEAAILFFSTSDRLRRRFARATHSTKAAMMGER